MQSITLQGRSRAYNLAYANFSQRPTKGVMGKLKEKLGDFLIPFTNQKPSHPTDPTNVSLLWFPLLVPSGLNPEVVVDGVEVHKVPQDYDLTDVICLRKGEEVSL